MAIFVVIKQPTSADPGALERAVHEAYPLSHYVIADGVWLVAATGTAVDVSARLNLGADPLSNTGVVFEVGSYYGRANPAIWTWIKTFWEASGG